MNAIEHVWNALGKRVAGRQPPPQTLQDLERALLEEWDRIPQLVISSLIDSMPQSGHHGPSNCSVIHLKRQLGVNQIARLCAHELNADPVIDGLPSLRLRGLSPEFGLLKENSRKRTKIPTEQEAKPAVVTPSLQQWRRPSTFRGAPGEDPLKWLKEYDRVANFNKWDDMMCMANVYFFLDGTARQWYVNKEDALDSWESFKNGLSGLFGDRQKYTREKGRRTTKMPSPACRREYTVLHTKCIRTFPRGKSPLMREDEKVSHLMKGVAEDIYQALLTREIKDTASFIKWCNYIEDMKQKRVGRPRFERLPNVVPVASLTDETDLVSVIRTIVREEVHRLVNQTQESLDSDPQFLEEIVQDEVERVLAPVSTKPTETRPRPTYAAVTRKYRAPVQKFPPEPRKKDVWRTADNIPVCFLCGRPGHVMRYCRERKAVFENSRNRRRNFDDVGTEEEIRRPNSSRRFTPSPTRGRSPIRRYRSPSPYRRSSQSPGRRSEEN
ncbi:CCHC-type domain-containing protein [Trichonephila clavipes]|uniref:CCHC-type domain-containing protein n=1 Tax=Trichonephila clavipes TaxID=2585209 RepID=A0A8X6VS13_TRICX|nr:CCHC-type domain-containing protein [Trichonephila clavipes]